MNEAEAREVTLLQAFETAQPVPSSWGEEDRSWANRVAVEAAGARAGPDEFLAQRARHAMQRLAPREPAATRWLARPLWRLQGVAVIAVIAFFVGAFVDSIGADQRINLLDPPLWGVLVWNALFYIVLLASLLAALLRRASPLPGPIVRGMRSAMRLGQRVPRTGAWPRFALLWSERSARLSILRAETLLHTGAWALALGLIAGLYARGLVLDYRAAWESTFLSPQVAHALVSGLLGPASSLSGIAIPDVSSFAALQSAHGQMTEGASAAPWIHLFALSLLLYVVVPRALLALACAAWARRRALRFELALNDPYFQRLLQLQRGGTAQVQVWPYAIAPTPQAVLGVRALLVEVFGARVGLQIAPSVAFSDEDRPAPNITTSHAVVWFDLTATPEIQTQGRFVQQLAASLPSGASLLVLIDETAFERRFGAIPERLAQRRDAWRHFCEELGTLPIFADLEAPEHSLVEPALQAALARPVQVSAIADSPTMHG